MKNSKTAISYIQFLKLMSKIGKMPIKIPEGVQVEIQGHNIKISGPKGVVEKILPEGFKVEVLDQELRINIDNKGKSLISIHGTTRAILANAVKGVSEGWRRELELVGTGYRGEVSGNKLVLNIGFSHPVVLEAPEGINFKIEKNIITVEGIDKELVGHIASKIRSIRPPEPYKGKGIKYKDEVVRRKAGKAAKTGVAVK